MTPLAWSPPPQQRSRRGWWDAVIAELQQHPGEWAVVHEGTHHTAGRPLVRRGCEVLRHRQYDGYRILARWPEPPPPKDALTFACQSCDRVVAEVSRLESHCRLVHQRPASTVERTPLWL